MGYSTATLCLLSLALACSSPKFEVVGDGGTDAGGAGGQDASAGGSSGSGGSSASGGLAGGTATGGLAGTAGAGGGTGGNTGCNGQEVCAPQLPSGWFGPFAVARQQGAFAEPTCPAGWSNDPAFSANQKLQPGPSCSCTCGGSASCSGKIEVTAFAETGSCTTPCIGPFTLDSSCQFLPSGCGSRIQIQAATIDNNCDPLSTSVPAPKWDFKLTSCGSSGGDQCIDGGLCFPRVDPPFNRICIAKQGDVPCSEPGYSNKELGHKNYSDTRKCTGKCKCDVFDPGTVNVHPQGGCTTPAAKIKATQGVQCQPGVDTGPLNFTMGACNCTPSGLGTTGAATATNPITYCCTT